MKRALILDFGGVISRTLFETHDETERALGLPAGTLTWRGPFDPPSDPLWQAMQRGELTERGYWLQRSREVGALLGETWNAMETLVQRARGAEPDRIVRPETAALVREAQAAGVRLAILSNELDLFYGRSLRERLPLLQAFEHISDATYTGVLKPRSFEMIRDQLAQRGMLGQAADFVHASGKLAALQYKGAIEEQFRTPGLGGFSLLSLQDQTGYGLCSWGMVDAFWDSKGLITPEAWREFCSETVPVLRFPKRV